MRIKIMKKIIGFRGSITSFRGIYAVLECGHEVYFKDAERPKAGAKRLCRVCQIAKEALKQ